VLIHSRERGSCAESDVEKAREHEQRVATALANSCAVLAAYCRADAVANIVPEEHLSRFPGFVQVPQGDCAQSRNTQGSASSTASGSSWLQQRAARRQKILVGLVRASSDRHFVGTLDEIMVHPGLQRRGLGRRCAMFPSYRC
jgi:hypothetical protein